MNCQMLDATGDPVDITFAQNQTNLIDFSAMTPEDMALVMAGQGCHYDARLMNSILHHLHACQKECCGSEAIMGTGFLSMEPVDITGLTSADWVDRGSPWIYAEVDAYTVTLSKSYLVENTFIDWRNAQYGISEGAQWEWINVDVNGESNQIRVTDGYSTKGFADAIRFDVIEGDGTGFKVQHFVFNLDPFPINTTGTARRTQEGVFSPVTDLNNVHISTNSIGSSIRGYRGAQVWFHGIYKGGTSAAPKFFLDTGWYENSTPTLGGQIAIQAIERFI